MKTAKNVTGWMVIVLSGIGVLSFFFAVLAVFNQYDYIGAGLCLLAAAFAFGTILKAYAN